MLFEQWQAFFFGVVQFDAIGKLWVERADVVAHFFKQCCVVDNNAAIVAAELFTNHSHCKWWFAIQQCWRSCLLCLGTNFIPLLNQSSEVGGEFVFGGILCSRTHNDSVLFWLDAIKNSAQAATLAFWQSL